MPNWATGSGVKVERAKKHIRDLETEISLFLQSGSYSSITQSNDETGEWIFYASVREEPPIEWGAIAGDAIHNLRSSLDVLWNSIYPGRGNRNDGFPFCDSPEALEKRFGEAAKTGRDKGVMNILKNAEPYKLGNYKLGQLHLLDIEDKHHILLPVGAAVPKMITDMAAGFRQVYLQNVSPSFVTRQFHKPVYPVHSGTILGRVPINPEGPQVDMNPEFVFDIAFGQPKFIEGQSIIATLNDFSKHVDGVVKAFITADLLS